MTDSVFCFRGSAVIANLTVERRLTPAVKTTNQGASRCQTWFIVANRAARLPICWATSRCQTWFVVANRAARLPICWALRGVRLGLLFPIGRPSFQSAGRYGEIARASTTGAAIHTHGSGRVGSGSSTTISGKLPLRASGTSDGSNSQQAAALANFDAGSNENPTGPQSAPTPRAQEVGALR